MDIPIKRFDKGYPLPSATEGAACFDLICSETVTIKPHQIKPIKQNVAVRIPDGYALLLFSRSSTVLRQGLMLSNSVGVIDPFYYGDADELLAFMLNITDEPVTVGAGDRVIQGMIMRTEPVTWHEVQSMDSKGHGGYNHAIHFSKD
jgi:dUTP pyrophosphatase